VATQHWEEVAAGLEHLFGQNTGIDLSQMRSLATEIERRANYELAPNKPFMGDDIFQFCSRMIISSIQKYPDDFLPFDPSMVGQATGFEVGKYSERPSFEVMLERRSADPAELADEEYEELLEQVQMRAQTQKRPFEDHEFFKMVRDLRPDLDV